MVSNKIVSRGNDNLNIQNNGDVHYDINLNKDLNKSEIYKLLLTIDGSSLPDNINFENIIPAEFGKKLEYNNVNKYGLIFDECSNDQFLISEVIESDIIDSETIMKKLRTLFIKNANVKDGKIVVGNGDEQLEEILKTLIRTIKDDFRYPDSDITIEKIEEFTYGLMAYGVMKCKILKNPNE